MILTLDDYYGPYALSEARTDATDAAVADLLARVEHLVARFPSDVRLEINPSTGTYISGCGQWRFQNTGS